MSLQSNMLSPIGFVWSKMGYPGISAPVPEGLCQGAASNQIICFSLGLAGDTGDAIPTPLSGGLSSLIMVYNDESSVSHHYYVRKKDIGYYRLQTFLLLHLAR